jgi:hypothetical protein
VHAEGVFGARPSRLQRVQTHARNDGRKPPPEVVDPVGPGAADAQPGILDRLISLRERSQRRWAMAA